MSKVTFVVEYPDGQEPSVGFNTPILGGQILSVAFSDMSERLEWRELGEPIPKGENVIVAYDGDGYVLLHRDVITGEFFSYERPGQPVIERWFPLPELPDAVSE